MKKILWISSAVVIAVVLFSFKGKEGDKRKPSQRPDIVIFLADDLGYNDTEPYGNKVVKTTNLNSLTAQSVKFTNAFANTPTCIPSRCSFYTGVMPIRNGSHANNVKGYPVSKVRPGIKSLPHYLKAAGYRVALAGKRHIAPLSAFPFEFIANSEVREPGYENKPGLFTDLNTAVVEDWLSKQDKEQPFCLVVCDNSPHVIWPEKPMYKKEDVDVPANAVSTDEYRRMRSRYYTDVTKMDKNLGIVLNSLKKNGLDENTIFIFTSDQGAQFPFAKWNLYDDGVPVPLLIKWPGMVKPGTTNALVSHVDMLPTLLSLTGSQVPGGLDGKSYLDVLTKNKKQHQKQIFLTHSQDGLMNITPMRGVRTERFKYILNLSRNTNIGGASYWITWEEQAKTDGSALELINRYYYRPKEELYDIVEDSHEQNNLAAYPKFPEEMQEMRKQLAAFRRAQNDTITGPILDIENTWKSEKQETKKTDTELLSQVNKNKRFINNLKMIMQFLFRPQKKCVKKIYGSGVKK